MLEFGFYPGKNRVYVWTNGGRHIAAGGGVVEGEGLKCHRVNAG